MLIIKGRLKESQNYQVTLDGETRKLENKQFVFNHDNDNILEALSRLKIEELEAVQIRPNNIFFE
jgi:hypothetical protein